MKNTDRSFYKYFLWQKIVGM